MKIFDFPKTIDTLYTPDIVAMLAYIHEHRGKQGLFLNTYADALSVLLEVAKIQSTGASNRLEGISTTDKRLKELISNKSAPRNRTEQEIAGYRDVLATIHESHDYIHPRPNVILQLHKQLFSFSQGFLGDSYKFSDNLTTQKNLNGKMSVRFKPTPAYLTANAMQELCSSYQECLESAKHDALLLIPVFILDFLCIHPFSDGNGRMARLLALLLLYRAEYFVGKYISLERLIENSKDTYYESLQSSSEQWHDNKNDYKPFVRYMLAILHKACLEFEERIGHLQSCGLSKPERIRKLIEGKVGKITKAEILGLCPDISKITVERTLAALVVEGYLAKVGFGRSTGYEKT